MSNPKMQAKKKRVSKEQENRTKRQDEKGNKKRKETRKRMVMVRMSVAVYPVRRQCPRCQASGFTDHDQGPHGYPVLEGRPMTLLSVLVSTGGTFIRSLLTFTVTPHTRKAPQLLHGRTAGSPCRDIKPRPEEAETGEKNSSKNKS